MIFQRYFVPGLVIMAVMVGGGYATGRELVEFFLAKGPATGLVGMITTALIMAAGAMVSFELARQFRAFDYRSFCRMYLGRFWWLFEFGYIAILLIILSVVSSAAGKLLADMLGSPEAVNSFAFVAMVALLVLFGSRFIERVIATWSLLFYLAYGVLLLVVVARFSDRIGAELAAQPIDYGAAIWSGISYTGYNIVVVPILIFVARNFRSRSEALIAGALAGPLILLPGFAMLLVLSAFYPAIRTAPIPVSDVLRHLDIPVLAITVRLVILGALIKTGTGMLHGLNERIARAVKERGRSMPQWARPVIAFSALGFAFYVAAAIGIVDLIKTGYRFSSYFFLIVFLLPVMTRGIWLISQRGRGQPVAESPTGQSVQADPVRDMAASGLG